MATHACLSIYLSNCILLVYLSACYLYRPIKREAAVLSMQRFRGDAKLDEGILLIKFKINSVSLDLFSTHD